MHFINYLAVLSVIAALASAADYNVTSSTQDYFLLSQRKLQNDIAMSELKIDSVNARGADHIKLIGEQQQVVLQEIQRVEQSLVPLQALSLIRKYCVQKYKPLLVTWDTAQKQFAACIATAQTRVNSLTTAARTSLNSAKTAANTNLPKTIATCNTTYALNDTKREECVLTNVDTYSKTVQTNLNAVDKNLEASLCTSSDLSRDAVQCSFVTERTTLVTIGSVLDLIDNCIKEAESSCPCANPNSTSLVNEKSVRNIVMGTFV